MALSNCNTNLYSVQQRNQSRKMGRDLAGSTFYTPIYRSRVMDSAFTKKFAGSLYPETHIPCSGMDINTDWQMEIAPNAGRKNHIQAGLPFDGGFHR